MLLLVMLKFKVLKFKLAANDKMKMCKISWKWLIVNRNGLTCSRLYAFLKWPVRIWLVKERNIINLTLGLLRSFGAAVFNSYDGTFVSIFSVAMPTAVVQQRTYSF